MTETSAPPAILTSWDYDQFEFINGNRNVREGKVAKIVRDIQNGVNLLQYFPILCFERDGALLIIDGQHRFESAVQTQNPVYYIVANEIPIREIARLNNNTDKWSNADFFNCYINLGKVDYHALREFMKKWKVSVSVGSNLLMNYTVIRGGGRAMEQFKDGQFEVRHMKKSEAFMKKVDRLFSNYTFYRDRELMKAVMMLENAGLWDIDHMEKKIKAQKRVVDWQSTAKNYIFMLERIYNHNQKIRKTIF